MSNTGMHLGAWAWAVFAGSHIPPEDWNRISLLRSAGITSAKYILYEGAPDTQFEDIRRLRQERDVQELVLRLMHGRRLPAPLDFYNKYWDRLAYAARTGFRLVVQPINEPNLELDMTPAELDAWFPEIAFLLHRDFAGIEVVSPPIAPYAPNSWGWWDGTRECVSAADSVGVNLNSNGDLSGAYSLPWWKGQTDKPLRVLECGAKTGTSAADRTALLPRLYIQLAAEPRVRAFYPFIMSSEGAEHAEHWYNEALITLLRQVAQGVTPTEPEPPTPPQEPSDPFAGEWTLEVGNVRIPFRLYRSLL